jgi:hypothetical protein
VSFVAKKLTLLTGNFNINCTESGYQAEKLAYRAGGAYEFSTICLSKVRKSKSNTLRRTIKVQGVRT